MREITGSLDGSGLRMGIVASRFNERVVRPLVDGALDVLRRVGVSDDDLTVVWVPGAYELPIAAQIAAVLEGRTDARTALQDLMLRPQRAEIDAG